jgi:hypothetical protein
VEFLDVSAANDRGATDEETEEHEQPGL